MTTNAAARLVPPIAAMLVAVFVGRYVADASQIKQVVATPDPWAVTTDDAVSALRVFTSGGANLDAKIAAVIQADRKLVKARVPAVEVQPDVDVPDAPATDAVPSRIMVDRYIDDSATATKHVLDLAAYDSVDFAADGRVTFGIGGFNVVKVRGTAALSEHLKGYYKYADVSK